MAIEASGSRSPERKRIRKALLDSEDAEPEQASAADRDMSRTQEATSTKHHGKKARRSAAPSKEVQNTDRDLEMYAYDLIHHMRACFREDQHLNEQNKPAFVKIENIESICAKIMKKDAREALLKMGVLGELKAWLEPLPDNSLPNPKVKKWILDLLLSLKVSKNDLLASGIGKIINFYYRNPKEAADIRKQAGRVVKKWKAQVIREEFEE